MKTILICDDDPIARMNLKYMLLELGFDEVLECENGKKAVEMALVSFPDMIFLEVAIPEMDGITATKEIKKKFKIPILLQSNGYDSLTLKRAAESGTDALLTKPVRQQDLLPAMEIAIAHCDEVSDLKGRINDLREVIENRKIIEKAKGILMVKDRLSEADAYRSMQKIAMDQRKSLRQVADGIVREG